MAAGVVSSSVVIGRVTGHWCLAGGRVCRRCLVAGGQRGVIAGRFVEVRVLCRGEGHTWWTGLVRVRVRTESTTGRTSLVRVRVRTESPTSWICLVRVSV